MKNAFALLAVALMAGTHARNARAANDSDLPPMVREAIADAKKDCRDKVVLQPGFITRKDVNGDGISDYVLDYGKFKCGDNSTLYCGTGGCVTQVFVSLPDGGFLKALDENVRDIRFAKIKGRSAMILSLHGIEGFVAKL